MAGDSGTANGRRPDVGRTATGILGRPAGLGTCLVDGADDARGTVAVGGDDDLVVEVVAFRIGGTELQPRECGDTGSSGSRGDERGG